MSAATRIADRSQWAWSTLSDRHKKDEPADPPQFLLYGAAIATLKGDRLGLVSHCSVARSLLGRRWKANVNGSGTKPIKPDFARRFFSGEVGT